MAGGPRSGRRGDDVRIGERLRRARTARGLTIADVGDASGLSKGFLSLLERDRTTASVPSLLAICEALGITIGALFDPPRTRLIRREARVEANFGGYGIRDSVLTPGSERALQVLESIIEPGGTSGEELHAFQADAELIYVLSGTLEIVFARDTYRLRAGDALTLSPREPHRWRNLSTRRRAVVLWIITPSAL